MTKMKKYGLIGYPLGHSFSKGYFAEKFKRESIRNCSYDNYPLENISQFLELVLENQLKGLNVTIPYKQEIIPYLDALDETAAKIGAVNTIKFIDKTLIGFNTDVYGFEQSLKPLLKKHHSRALVLGTGGSSKAVIHALSKLGISYQYVSRNEQKGIVSYNQLNEAFIQDYKLIINTTPLGMYPKVETAPAIPYSVITKEHLLYDLVYNPEKTKFLLNGQQQGAVIKNGLDMLKLQAEKAWEIWNS